MSYKESTAPLLRPEQELTLREEERRIQGIISGPSYVSDRIQERPQMHRNARNVRKRLEEQAPKPYEPEVVDKAVARSNELQQQFTTGMPTQAEMRRNPPGAVDKHMGWEKRNKEAIMEWKNIQLRLRAGGQVDDGIDVANIERFRPVGGSAELNMDNAHIPGTRYHMPYVPEIRNVMSDEDRERIAEETRQAMLAEGYVKKSGMSEEHKRKMAEGRERARQRKEAANGIPLAE